jgi:hypothetical protein
MRHINDGKGFLFISPIGPLQFDRLEAAPAAGCTSRTQGMSGSLSVYQAVSRDPNAKS